MNDQDLLSESNYCDKCKEVYDGIHCKCFPNSFVNIDDVLGKIMGDTNEKALCIKDGHT